MTYEYIKNHFWEPNSLLAKKELFLHSVKNVILEVTTFCNRKCVYCPVALGGRDVHSKIMEKNIFSKVLEDLASVSYKNGICLNLYNEPMADKYKLIETIVEIKKILPSAMVYFGTNGDYLNKDYLRELAQAGLSHMNITLHHPKGRGYTDEYSIERFTEFASRMSVTIKIKNFVKGRTLKGEFNAQGISFNIFSANYEAYGTNRAESLTTVISPRAIRISPCNRPFTDVTISYDGTIFPCCQFYADSPEHKRNFSIGNIGDFPSLFDAYACGAMVKWRRSLFTYDSKTGPCATCSESSNFVIDEKDKNNRELLRAEFFS